MIKRIIAATTIALTLSGTAFAAALPTATQCTGTVKTIATAGYVKTTANNTKFILGDDSTLYLSGNGNCVIGGKAVYVKVTGNNNYVTGSYAGVTMVGTNNYFQSQGYSYVKCGGGSATVDPNTDGYKNCVLL